MQRTKYTFAIVAVVAFTGDDSEDESVEAVPSLWLTPKKSHCYWPPFTQPGKVRKAIAGELLPMTDWKKYDARCLKMCSKYYSVCDNILLTTKYAGFVVIP